MPSDQAFIARFARDHIEPMARVHWNPVFRRNWTPATRRATAELLLWLVDEGYDHAVEVRMLGCPLRADVLVPELYGSQVIEICDTETDASKKRKEALFDKAGVSVLFVPADFNEALALIKAANGLK